MNRHDLRASLGLALALAFVAFSGVRCTDASAAGFPGDAERYRRELIRSARYVFGMSAPVAVLAGQVHQESGWRPEARSAFASGLAQFTPATAKDMTRLYSEELGPVAMPTNPRWALMAMCRYDARLLALFPAAASPAERWAFALSAYNGGPGWTLRDRAKAKAQGLDPERWFGQVETVNAGRAPQFFRENRDYPRRILLRHQALYRSWGPGVDVSEVRP